MKLSMSLKSPICVSIVVLVAASVFSTQANAGCSMYDTAHFADGVYQTIGFASAESVPESAMFMRVSNDATARYSIVGTWKFKLLAEGNPGIPDGTQLDFGTVQWHDDGTEFTISGSRPPMAGDVCMGAWKQTGRSTFKLNHLALAWDNTGTVFVGPATLVEFVTVDRGGDSYSGTFTVDQYAVDEVTVLAHVTGVVMATRMTAD